VYVSLLQFLQADLPHLLDWLSFPARDPYLKFMCMCVSLLPLLQVDLPHFLDWLSDLAKDPLSRERRRQLKAPGGGLGPEAAALLRFKEADQARSNLHR